MPRPPLSGLASLKAQAVCRPGALVIGCDQILVCHGLRYDKPANLGVARAHLQSLRGRTHVLATATVAVREGHEVWRHVATPRLSMRRLTDAFIDLYLAAEGAALLRQRGGLPARRPRHASVRQHRGRAQRHSGASHAAASGLSAQLRYLSAVEARACAWRKARSTLTRPGARRHLARRHDDHGRRFRPVRRAR